MKTINKKNCSDFENHSPDWCVIIQDLQLGAGYSYTDIARLSHLSISEIQKLATGKLREPKCKVYQALLILYCKTFYGKEKLNHAAMFLKLKKQKSLAWLEELLII